MKHKNNKKEQEKNKLIEKYEEIYRISGFYGLLGLAKRGQIKKYDMNYAEIKKYFGSHAEAIKEIFDFDINAEIPEKEVAKLEKHAFSYFRNYGFCKASELLKEEFGIGSLAVIEIHPKFLRTDSNSQYKPSYPNVNPEKRLSDLKEKLIEKKKEFYWSGNEKLKEEVRKIENEILEIRAAMICKEHLDSVYEDTLNKKLHALGIEHEHNVKYPMQYERTKENKDTNSFPTCDFRIREFWIEYAGLWKFNPEKVENSIDFVKYKHDLEEKRKIAIKNKIKLVVLYPFETDLEKENKLEMIIKETMHNKIKFKLYTLKKYRSSSNAEQESHVSNEPCSFLL